MKMRILHLVIVSVCAVTSPLGAVSFTEDFSGGILPDRWNIVRNDAAGAPWTIAAPDSFGGLQLSKTADSDPSSSITAGIRSQFQLIGNFSVTVNFNLLNFPLSNNGGWNEAVLRVGFSAPEIDLFQVLRYAGDSQQGSEGWISYTPTTGHPLVSGSDSTLQGSFGVTRSGETISAWINRGAGFVFLGSESSASFTGPADIELLAVQQQDATLSRPSTSLEVRFDNLSVTAESIVPEPSTFALLGLGAFGLLAWAWRRKSHLVTISIVSAMIMAADVALADSFGTGGNQFTINFVPISGATNPISGYGIVNNDYRMGTYEITNDQWNKFKTAYGMATGSPSSAYDTNAYYTGTNVPTNDVSWYEAAQFVNWLNTSTGHHAAYKFAGTQGASDYAMSTWSAAEADKGTNLYRHKDAFYFLPTIHEWTKAGYWNGTTIQNYATKDGDWPPQGNGTSGTGWNYWNNSTAQFATTPPGPWIVGSGSQELNGTYDMMGNVWEWMENPFFMPNSEPQYNSTNYPRGVRGGSFSTYWGTIISSDLGTDGNPTNEFDDLGFRVASVPEPSTIILLGMGILGGIVYAQRRKYIATRRP